MYLKRFIEADKRTKKFGLISPDLLIDTTTPLFSTKYSNDIPSLLNECIPNYTTEDLMGQCINVSYKMQLFVEKYFNTDVYLTFGYIMLGEKEQFRFTESDIEKMLKGESKVRLNIHTWLTFPNMEILDLTYITTYVFANDIEAPVNPFLFKPANSFNGMEYYPMLLGKDFLIKSGIMVEFEQF